MKTLTHEQIPRTSEARVLKHRVRALRWRHHFVTLSTGLAIAVAAAVGLLALDMLADWRLELPWPVRCSVLLAGIAGLSWLVLSRFCRLLNDDAVALMVERALPNFRGRFIASVQLSKSRERATSAALVHALLAETVAIESQLDFQRVVNTTLLRRAVLLAVASLATAGVLLQVGNPMSILLLKRAILFNDPIPRATRILAVTGDRKIALGDNLAIEARAEGVIPQSGRLLVKTRSGQTHEFSLESDSLHQAHFRRVVESPQESFSYSIRLNDAATPTFQVTVLQRPTVLGLECEQVYPPYTRLGSVRRTMGDLALLAGSRLNLTITASSNIKQGVVQLVGTDRNVPVQIDPQDRTRLTATVPIPAKDATGFSINLTDENGIASRDSATHRFEIVPDRPPTVKITIPASEEELVTPQGVLLVGFEAGDDFWIGKAALHYAVKVDGAAEAIEKTVELEVGEGQKSLSRRFNWKISSLIPRPAPGNIVEYWVEVADTNDLTGPGIGVSAHYHAKIVTPEEKQAELAKRLMNSFQGLHDVATDQKKLNEDVGTMIYEKHAQ